MKKIALYCLAICCVSTLYAQFPARQRSAAPTEQDQRDPSFQLQKFSQFFTYLNMSYVDTINNVKITEDAIKQVLSELDPHSAYVSPDEMKEVNESFSGSFSGIGVEFNILKDTLIVVNTIVGGPAEKVGVLPNDRIVTIDSQYVLGIKQNEVPDKLRGPKGTVVEIGVIRRGEPSIISFRIVRDNIPINAVDAAYRINPNTGYIKVNRFSNTTMSEFNAAMDKFGDIDALVLDLRGNGGGLLNQAVDMSETFLNKGSLIVFTEGRLAPAERYSARADGRFTKGKLIVLIDENSASASEIVAGAVQDWDRGLIVGRRSFGKGLVQRQFPLIDGSSVRITVSRYHTPTGRVIQRPFEMGHTDEYYASHFERSALADSIATSDTLTYKTLRKGRTVYGGGGIFPDVFVAADTTGYSNYWAQLVRRGVINEFIIEYMDSSRASIEAKHPDFKSFLNGYQVDQAMLDQLVALGKKRDVPYDAEGMEISSGRFKEVLKALVAQKMWGMNEYYRVINASDEMLIEAQRLLKEWDKDFKSIL